MFKVMIRDNMAPIAKEILEATGEIAVVVDNDKTSGTPESLFRMIQDVDAIAVKSSTRITAEVLKHAEKLKVIGRAGFGLDNIDVSAATKKGIVVMNAPGGNAVTTGEHTISLLMALARNIPQGNASLRQGKWEKKNLTGVEITSKTLGIVGLGQIGRIVAERAKGLKMHVIAADPYVSKDAAAALDVELVSFNELLSRSDFVSLHVPCLKETINLIRASTIRKMKQGVRIINTSRGEIIELDDLYESIVNGHVAGAALDVFPHEPPDPSLPIFRHPNLIYTPHWGASTDEAQTKVAEMVACQIAAYLINGVIINAVNFPSVSREVMDRLKPYLDLAGKMGSLMGQLVRGVHDMGIVYSGDMALLDTRPLTHAILKGYLESFTDVPVNDISAPAIAEEKGIDVKETISKDMDDFAGVIKIRLENQQQGMEEIWGTVFGKQYPRIVRLGKISMDAIPEGSMIVIQNMDRPGVIGHIGTTLGRHGINIGRFQLGRRHDRAVCMVNIDSPADETVLDELKSLPNIISVTQVHLRS